MKFPPLNERRPPVEMGALTFRQAKIVRLALAQLARALQVWAEAEGEDGPKDVHAEVLALHNHVRNSMRGGKKDVRDP